MLDQTPAPRWRLATRLAFRFCFLYFSFYTVLPKIEQWLPPVSRLLDKVQVMDGLVAWTGSHVFHVIATPVESGSGDTMYDWVSAFCTLLIAAAGTAAWSVLGRRRGRYERLDRWFRVLMRFALGSTMISYGFAKVIPMQMPAPSLTRLLEPYGNFSPMGALWYSIGASFPYEIFVGGAEVLGGVLLFIPRTATVGALICLADTIEIFTLNMTYDVPVKLFSFHLILMSLFLLAPDIKRLVGVAFAKGARTRWAAIAQVAFGAYLVGMSIYSHVQQWHEFGGGVPRPPLYGIWVIDEMTIDGITRPPLVTDLARWRRVVIQRSTDIAFWRMDDTFVAYPAKTDMDKKVITLSDPTDKARAAQLTFDRLTPNTMTFDGSIDGRALHMYTHLVTRDNFLLVNRGFHWIQEFPFNR
jgi:uncharacterized membrane protein YphA (DoxX/SURF4 family)